MSEAKLITNPVKCIRRYCLLCCRESPSEVANCPAEDCWLHPFRMGSNPYRAQRSEAQIAAAKEAIRKANFDPKSPETQA